MGKRAKKRKLKASASEQLSIAGIDTGESSGGTGNVVAAVDTLPDAVFRYHTGDKFAGGFGVTEFLETDYWTLRARSAQLFKTNHYAYSIVSRLVDNIIHTGLNLESRPNERALGMVEDSLQEWSDVVEDQFELWANSKEIVDPLGESTFGQIQETIKRESIIEGDVLVMMPQEATTRLPQVQTIVGSKIRSVAGAKPHRGNSLHHGVERDQSGRHVAYWTEKNGKPRRIASRGSTTGRRIAWMVYGGPRRHDEVRGTPLLSLVLQSLRELDRYRDATVRKAVVNSMVALFIEQGERVGSKIVSMSGGATLRNTETATDSAGVEQKPYKIAEYAPGFVAENLPHGSKLHAFGNSGTDDRFGPFEDAIIDSVSWSYGIPPELLRLSFKSNYSASQAAINEFKAMQDRARTDFGLALCLPVYQEWLLAEQRRPGTNVAAPGLLEASRRSDRFDIVAAWTLSSWIGNIKPSVDPVKLVKAYQGMLGMGAITFDRAARELTGMSFRHVVRQQRKERELLSETLKFLPVLGEQLNTEPESAEETDQKEDAAAARVLALVERTN